MLALEPGRDENDAPVPRKMTLENGAREVFKRWHDKHAERIADADDDLSAALSKQKGVCVRLALVMQCVAIAGTGRGAAVIETDVMQRVCVLTDWFAGEAQRLYGRLEEDETDKRHRRLAEWVGRHGGRVTPWQVARGLRELRGAVELATEALDGLVAAGWGDWERPAPGPAGGRPALQFRLKPGLGWPEKRDGRRENPGSHAAGGVFSPSRHLATPETGSHGDAGDRQSEPPDGPDGSDEYDMRDGA